MNFAEIETRLNYVFKDKSILQKALTLPSANSAENNQTLEFFGDAILEFVVSEKIYDENLTEGQLTERRKALVADSSLKPVSERLGLDGFLIRGVGDNKNLKAVPSAYEAVTAAIYLDGGMAAAKKFVLSTLDFSVKNSPNFKGDLQEYLQSKGEDVPEYSITDCGTPQKPLFKAEISVYGQVFTGEASKKQQAEQNAARLALEYLKN